MMVLGDLLIDTTRPSEYFSYKGSMTKPGCEEVVTWIVMAEPILVPKIQVVNAALLVNFVSYDY